MATAFLPPVSGNPTFGYQPTAQAMPALAAEGPAAYLPPPTAPVAVAAKPSVTQVAQTGSTTARDNATGALAGLAAAGQIQPGTDPTSAATSAAAAGLTAGGTAFVASGFNPIVGLAAGGGATLASLVNSWMSTKATRKRDRDRNRLLEETQRRQEQRDRIARQDAIEEQGYNRRQTAVQTAWGQNVEQMKRITDAVNNDAALKDRFIKLGRV